MGQFYCVNSSASDDDDVDSDVDREAVEPAAGAPGIRIDPDRAMVSPFLGLLRAGRSRGVPLHSPPVL